MKILNKKFARTLTAAAVVAGAAAMLSMGAFAAEADDGVVAGYLPPQDQMTQGSIALYAANDTTPAAGEDVTIVGYLPPQDQMVQGEIALHSEDQKVPDGEQDPAYGGYGAPEGDAIQGDIMLISADADAEPKAAYAANYTVKGLLGKQVLYTARQDGRVLTLAAPENTATFRTTVGEMKKLLDNGVSTLVLTTNKTSTTLNLTLLCEGSSDNAKVVLRHCGANSRLTVGGKCRRDLLIGR